MSDLRVVMKADAPTRRLAIASVAVFVVGGGLLYALSSGTQRRSAADLLIAAGYADSLELALDSARAPDSSAVVAAMYLQRARLGMGSPFRLVEHVVRDRRLEANARRLVALAIVSRTRDGLVYSSPVDGLGILAPDGRSNGLAHRTFIERATAEAADPRSAELALRLAYQIGTSSGAVSHRASAVAISAIAQARDRALAMRDARDLIAAAQRGRLGLVDLVPTWRATRRFRVEQPLRDPANLAQEREAMAMLPRLLRLVAALSDSGQSRGSRERTLGLGASVQASRVAQRHNAPPQAPIVVTLGGFGSYVIDGGLSSQSRAARSAFVARTRNEETLVAEYALLRAQEGVAAEASLAVLTSGVALRPYAQSRAWLPGDDGPSPLELETKLGLASLRFDDNVPAVWRPFFTSELDGVVRDLRVVFPELDLGGLSIRFGESPMGDRALALHDPASRTIYFPPGTSSGAMAHELLHDLDWQAARRHYRTSSGYRTDRSVRQYRDGLAATFERLSSSTRAGVSGRRGSGERPTEAFARAVDWIVASALAQHGVLNGSLSAVQDETITGYASATPPRRDSPQANATIVALREIADVSPGALAWFDTNYGSERRIGIADGVRRVLMAPLPRVEERVAPTLGFNASTTTGRLLRASASAGGGGGGGWSCLLSAPSLQTRDRDALRQAMEMTAAARVDGLLRRWGAGAYRVSGAVAGASRMRALGGAPWEPTITRELAAEMRAALLWRAARVDDGRFGLDVVERAERGAAWQQCAEGLR